jgi:UrcA family protein
MSMAVKCGDLNLASDAGIRALNERIRRAARRACGVASTYVADCREVFADCYQDTVARAPAQVHAAQVAALRDRTSPLGAN